MKKDRVGLQIIITMHKTAKASMTTPSVRPPPCDPRPEIATGYDAELVQEIQPPSA